MFGIIFQLHFLLKHLLSQTFGIKCSFLHVLIYFMSATQLIAINANKLTKIVTKVLTITLRKPFIIFARINFQMMS